MIPISTITIAIANVSTRETKEGIVMVLMD
jgi:hypothetical protein